MAEIKSIQPENDIFCSIYRKDYVFWKEYDHRTPNEHFDSYRLTPDQAKQFQLPETKADFSKMEQYLDDMKELNKLRLRTLYSLEYCPKSSYKILRNVDKKKFSPENDKFLIDGAIRFGVPQGQVPVPLSSARRVLAFSPYGDYRTPLSTYQDIHGRLGYDRVKEAADGGYWRMGPRYDHEKELAAIKNVLKREEDISERENEEKKMAESLLQKQLEQERENAIRKLQEKRASRKRGNMLSNRFGPDPRQVLESSTTHEAHQSMFKENSVTEEPKTRKKEICGHTMMEHEECLKQKRISERKDCCGPSKEKEDNQNTTVP